jgi:hypothetical protein
MSVIECGFFADDKNTDNSADVVKRHLGHLPGELVTVQFDGMGPTWTQLVEIGIKNYPNATHGIISDADFTPITRHLDKWELNTECSKHMYMIRSPGSSGNVRNMDWIYRNLPGAKVERRVSSGSYRRLYANSRSIPTCLPIAPLAPALPPSISASSWNYISLALSTPLPPAPSFLSLCLFAMSRMRSPSSAHTSLAEAGRLLTRRSVNTRARTHTDTHTQTHRRKHKSTHAHPPTQRKPPPARQPPRARARTRNTRARARARVAPDAPERQGPRHPWPGGLPDPHQPRGRAALSLSLVLPLSLSLARSLARSPHTQAHTSTHTRTHARTDAQTHARTHARTHTNTHTLSALPTPRPRRRL